MDKDYVKAIYIKVVLSVFRGRYYMCWPGYSHGQGDHLV